jgi:nucleoside 2-deoxyribosyltransferase
MENSICILCESSECKSQEIKDGFIWIRCKHGFELIVSEEIYDLPYKILQKVSNLIYERLLIRQDIKEKPDKYYYEEIESPAQTDPKFINVFPLLATYPDNIVERTNRSLTNLSRIYPTYGLPIGTDPLDTKACFCYDEDYVTEFKGMANILIELGYLTRTLSDSSLYTITAKGWQKIEELKRKEIEVKQAFVAMSFRSETNYIREAFKKAIESCGYLPVFIDEKEHNNQIVPEIFYEIGRSKFIVVDVTYPNDGAYYEAGFAQGLGKQVIVCCKKVILDDASGNTVKPHFDISQKSMVLWDDEQDLIKRLIKRIQSTVI